jgi:hypothetical protein
MSSMSGSRRAMTGLLQADLVNYLLALGWKRIHEDEGRFSLWANTAGNRSVQALLPLSQRFSDYDLRLAELLEALANFEQRAISEVSEDVRSVSTDVFRVRADPQVTQAGTIPLDDGVRLVAAARDMLVAAANAEHKPMALQYTRPSTEVDDVLRLARFGQTERSSYVVTLLVPVPPKNQLHLGESFPSKAEPLERRVGLRLLTALDALAHAALRSAETGSVEPIREAVQYGVSLNLCRAVVSAQPETGSLEVSGKWAPVRPLSRNTRLHPDRSQPQLVEFHRALISQVQEAVRTLAAALPQESVRVFGHIELLHQAAQESLHGEVRISGYADDQRRQVRVKLAREDYEEAIRAHKAKLLASVKGTLLKRGSSYVLEDPVGFSVLPDPRAGDIELEESTEPTETDSQTQEGGLAGTEKRT